MSCFLCSWFVVCCFLVLFVVDGGGVCDVVSCGLLWHGVFRCRLWFFVVLGCSFLVVLLCSSLVLVFWQLLLVGWLVVWSVGWLAVFGCRLLLVVCCYVGSWLVFVVNC